MCFLPAPDDAEVLRVIGDSSGNSRTSACGDSDPDVVVADAPLEEPERAVDLSERRTYDGELQVLDVIGMHARIQFCEAGPGLFDPSSACLLYTSDAADE